MQIKDFSHSMYSSLKNFISLRTISIEYISGLLKLFWIKNATLRFLLIPRLLSNSNTGGITTCKKGCPYDNSIAEAGYKIIKTEFAFNRVFKSLEELKLELCDYVNWYNNKRIHGSLNYMTPVEYRLSKMTE